MKTTQHISDYIFDFLITKGPTILLALVLLVGGMYVINYFSRWLEKRIQKRNIDVSLAHFLTSFFRLLLVALLLISVASMLGIATSSFVAVLGAAGLAVGLALQGSLSNFAGGMLILFFKPFKVGEYIASQDTEGTVETIDILNTTLCTLDNKVVIIPNGSLANSVVINFSRKHIRRVDVVVGIAYNADIRKAREVILNTLDDNELILKEPGIEVLVKELGDSAVNLAVRCWTATPNYWKVYFSLFENIKIALDNNGITIPFPQRDLHLYQHVANSISGRAVADM